MQQSENERGTVIVIEDDPDISKLLEINLSHMGFDIKVAYDGAKGLALALNEEPRLIILDVMLPEMDGLSVCQRLREKNMSVPILMLTARSEEADKILGLELGADDYLTKPFSIGELLARVRALLRRIERLEKSSAESAKTNELLVFGDISIDLAKREVQLRGAELQLTFKEFELLVYLATNPGRAFTREALLSAVWEYEYEGYQHTVTSHINRLRSKIEKDASSPEYILTVRGAGYRFVTEAELGADETAV